MQRRTALKLLAMAALAGCAPARTARPTPAPRQGLYVDAGYTYGPISPYVYASNTGPWQTVGLDQPQLAREGGLRMIRWPGGNWGDENNVTPLQLDEFMALCSKVGADPLIHVRLFGGTPEMAANLVRVANIEKGYKIRYWAIGNEPDLFVKKRGAASYTVADYVRDFKTYRTAMKAVDPSIIVMGPEISYYAGGPSDHRDSEGVLWMEGFLKGAGADIDLVTFHRYPFGETPPTPATLQADPVVWSRAMDTLAAQIRTHTGRDLQIGVTEANSDWTGRVSEETGTDSHLNALWWADVLGRLITRRAEIVAHFTLGYISAQGIGMFGPISYDPTPRPIYQVYRLFRQFGTQLVYAASDDYTLPIVAATREDGTLTVVVVNHGEACSAAIAIDNLRPVGPAAVWSFAADHPVAQRSTTDLAGPISFEARSATLLAVPVK